MNYVRIRMFCAGKVSWIRNYLDNFQNLDGENLPSLKKDSKSWISESENAKNREILKS